jgi:vancomycin resistance protein VanJ
MSAGDSHGTTAGRAEHGSALPTQQPELTRRSLRRGPAQIREQWLLGLSLCYLMSVLGVLAAIRVLGDRWWAATVLLFAPRWVALVPLLLLSLLAVWTRRIRPLGAQAFTALIVLGPLMGFNVPWKRLSHRELHGPRIRFLTFNLSQDPLDTDGFVDLLEREKVDIVLLQEWPEIESGVNRRLDSYLSKGWHRSKNRSIASRFPIIAEYEPFRRDAAEFGFWPLKLERVRIRAPNGQDFVVACTHLPTMRNGFAFLEKRDVSGTDRFLGFRRSQLRELANQLDQIKDVPVLLGGDLNTPADSPILATIHSRYHSAFAEAGFGWGYTCPSRTPWARIDQFFGSNDWTFSRCWVGPDLGSDHLPVFAEAVLARRGR